MSAAALIVDLVAVAICAVTVYLCHRWRGQALDAYDDADRALVLAIDRHDEAMRHFADAEDTLNAARRVMGMPVTSVADDAADYLRGTK